MARRSPSSTPERDLVLHDSQPTDSPPPTSQGGSGNGTGGDVARKTKELLANLEKEGVEIDGRIASIIEDEVARIKAEAARDNIKEPKGNGMTVLLTIASVAVGFIMGAEWCDYAIRVAVLKKILFGKIA